MNEEKKEDAPKQPHSNDHKGNDHIITVLLDSKPVQIERGTYTTEKLKEMFKLDPSLVLDIVEEGVFRTLKAGEETKLKKDMVFISHVAEGSSS